MLSIAKSVSPPISAVSDWLPLGNGISWPGMPVRVRNSTEAR